MPVSQALSFIDLYSKAPLEFLAEKEKLEKALSIDYLALFCAELPCIPLGYSCIHTIDSSHYQFQKKDNLH